MKAKLYQVSYLSRGCGVALQESHKAVPIATNFQSKFIFATSVLCRHSSQLKVTALGTHFPENGLYKLGWYGGAASC
jgi:hypothetical protein